MRGLRQFDPLSPVLFALEEEVLGRGILDLIAKGLVKPMVVYRGYAGPSHLLFADDVMFFTKGNRRGLRKNIGFRQTYQESSGQAMNKEKIIIFFEGIPLG